MEDVVWLLISALSGAVMYFIGSMLSPHAKAYKVQAQTWQGQYSGLKKQLVEIQGDIDDQDPLIAIGKSFGLDKRTIGFLRPVAEKYIQDFLAKQGQKQTDTNESWR
jgi:hypothetical protein